MPGGRARARGRSNAESIDDAEHSATVGHVMAGRRVAGAVNNALRRREVTGAVRCYARSTSASGRSRESSTAAVR